MERQTYVQTNGVSDLHQNFRSTADLHAEFEVYNSYISWDSLSTKIFVQTNRRTNGQKYLFRNSETSIRSEMFEKPFDLNNDQPTFLSFHVKSLIFVV